MKFHHKIIQLLADSETKVLEPGQAINTLAMIQADRTLSLTRRNDLTASSDEDGRVRISWPGDGLAIFDGHAIGLSRGARMKQEYPATDSSYLLAAAFIDAIEPIVQDANGEDRS